LEEWKKVERKHPGAWADFETDKFLLKDLVAGTDNAIEGNKADKK